MRAVTPLNSTHTQSTTMWLRATTYAWQSEFNTAIQTTSECHTSDYPSEETKCGKCGESLLINSDQSGPGQLVAVYIDCYYQYYHATETHSCSPCLDCSLSDGERFTVFTVREDG